jgi:hypothetical protein
MATKKKLQELLKERETPKRDVVTPVSLYTKPQVDKDTKESTQVDKSTSGQVVKTTKPQVDKETKGQVVKYTTHLKQEVIKDLKRYAFEHDIKDYEVMGEAIEKYLKGKGGL